MFLFILTFFLLYLICSSDKLRLAGCEVTFIMIMLVCQMVELCMLPRLISASIACLPYYYSRRDLDAKACSNRSSLLFSLEY